ncbi:MAG: cysteine hydrolase [Lachnospiraceae bacterium]|jgi:nicotinamidase-related amidase|nr:cysteine hydrolase [Lachnospiraceae bacterium]
MNNTALIIVDMVYDFTNPLGKVYYPKTEEIIPSILELLSACRKNNCLIVFMQHRYRENKFDTNLLNMRPCCIEGSGGEEIDERFHVNKDTEYIIPKRRYSSFFGTDLDLVLRENKIKQIIVAGTKTNNCINATVLDANYLDYDTYVVKECVATSDDQTNEIYLRDMGKYLCNVISLESALGRLELGEL